MLTTHDVYLVSEMEYRRGRAAAGHRGRPLRRRRLNLRKGWSSRRADSAQRRGGDLGV